ncbi:DUF4352 domain-containing protein [Listeria newyorkensis]|uniref:DUF4352 domain-containing protein n=1 Tax=Listeria newyorkensis TaxID=1497681 RepID=A0A841YZ56_9LIST|nr:DUF4352 domain-containing protein [Listeria newyorkensis]MBC1457837.1 DUF4352 domain-containing protein [Listeria newyorkensis]
MKKRNWIALFVLSLTLAMTVVGCGKTVSDDIGKTRTANDLEITVTNVEMKDSNNDKKQMAQIDFSIKNIGKEESGAGAGDFVIETEDGKKHQVYGLNANNFGDAIAAGKTLKGSGFYEIPANQKEFTVLYQPVSEETTEKIEWTITVPSK